MEILNAFKKRSSVNFFDTSKKFDLQLVKEIIDLAVLAPSAFNLQPWRIIVVESESGKAKLKRLSNNQDKVSEAAVTLILIGNKDGWNDNNPVWAEMLQSVGGNQQMVDGAKGAAAYLYGTSEDRKLKFAESNTGLLAMAIMMAATEYGVDTHPMSGIDFDGIKNEFALAENETVVMTITMGYFDQSKSLYPRRPRLGFDQIASVV
jgi:putative NAD(P)H nitroreductase